MPQWRMDTKEKPKKLPVKKTKIDFLAIVVA